MDPSFSFPGINEGFQFGINNGTVNASLNIEHQRPETPPEPCSTVPFNRDSEFIERGPLTSGIHAKCSQSARVALVGLGGVGKSQLLVEHSYRIREADPKTWVFWIHASNPSRFEASYLALAETLKIPGRHNQKSNIFQLVCNWLQDERKGKWVLMIDNLDDFFLDQPIPSHEEGSGSKRINLDSFLTYLPRSQNGSVIITTRSKEVALKLVYERDIILVEPMDQDHALALVDKKLLIPAKEEDAQRLVEKLDYMPLAIAQAVAYLNKRAERSSVTQYLEDFEKNDRKRIKLLQTEPSNPLRDYEAENTIMDTWQISFNHVRRTRPSAAAILSRASFCDRQGIPESLLRICPEPGEDTDSMSSDDFEDDIQILKDLLFISQSADGKTFEMHRLVQLATRNWLRVHKEFEDCQAQFLEGFAANFRANPTRQWKTSRILLPHVQVAYMQRPTREDALTDWASLLYLAYLCFAGQRPGRESLEMIQAAYDARKALLGANHPDTLYFRMLMGLVHGGRLGLEEEETILEEVMESSANFHGPENPEAVQIMPFLASAYVKKGRFSDAEAVLRKVLEVETKLSSIMQIDSSSGHRSLGERPSGLVRRDEDQEKVGQMHSFRDSKVNPSEYDWPISRSKIALAELYSGQSRWKEAEDIYHQALLNEILGPANPQRTFIMRDLTEVYWKQRKWKEAENVFQQSLGLDMEILGPDYSHHMSFSSMQRLANEYYNLGMLLEAEVFQRSWLKKLQKVLGNEHSGIMKMMIQLAVICNKQGRDTEARELVFNVLEGHEMTKDGGHLDFLDFAKLREVCLGQHLWKEAEVAEVRIIEEMERKFGPDHEQTKEERQFIMRQREEFKEKRKIYPEGA